MAWHLATAAGCLDLDPEVGFFSLGCSKCAVSMHSACGQCALSMHSAWPVASQHTAKQLMRATVGASPEDSSLFLIAVLEQVSPGAAASSPGATFSL